MQNKQLRVEKVSKTYNHRTVVNQVCMELNQGEIVGLLGPNGAGKTTTFNMVMGLIKPDQGAIFINDDNITKWPMYRRAQAGISYLCQEPSVFVGLSVEDNIRAILEWQKLSQEEQKQRLGELMERIHIDHLAHQPAFQLSGGEKRRVEICRALATSPSFMLLDEPFSGVDPLAVADIQNIIKELKAAGIGILITDHSVRETLEVTDKAYILSDGLVLASGPASELIENPRVKEVYLGENFYMRHHLQTEK